MRTSIIITLAAMLSSAYTNAQSLPNDPNRISFPHLIIKIDEAFPDKAFGTGYNGTVTPTISSIFNFEKPPTGLTADKKQTCELIFFFSSANLLWEEKSYEFNVKGGGRGGLIFWRLRRSAELRTTWNTQLRESRAVRYITDAAPGNTYSLEVDRCDAFSGVGYKMAAIGNTYLDFFQTYDLDQLRGKSTDENIHGKRFEPLGLFVIAY